MCVTLFNSNSVTKPFWGSKSYSNISDTGARVMEFGLYDGRDDAEHNGDGFLEIS